MWCIKQDAPFEKSDISICNHVSLIKFSSENE